MLRSAEGLCSFWDFLNLQTIQNGKTDDPEEGMHLPIAEGLIHVWTACYSDLEQDYPFPSVQLSKEELLKAAGYKKTGESQRYIIRCGLVRAVLGSYPGEDPDKIQFVYGLNGKPELDPEHSVSDTRFSLSSTDEKVCLGITRKSGIGVDIVRPQPHYPFSAIGHSLFTRGERRWIAQAAPDRRSMRFFRVWALKEALLKATGSDVRIMKEADVSPVMTDAFLDGFYSVNLGETDQRCFIYESGCGVGHHCALATIPKTNSEPDN